MKVGERMENIMDEKDVIKILRRNKDINCVAIVISSWHYLNALATIDFLFEKKKIRKGIILACYHKQGGFIIDENLWNTNINCHIEKEVFQFGHLPQWKEVKAYLREEISDKKDFYILRPIEPTVGFSAELWFGGLKKNFIHIVIDEGLGFYLRSAKGWRNEHKAINHIDSISNKEVMKKWYQGLYSKIFLKKREQLLYNTFFIKRGKQLKVNPICKKNLNNILRILSNVYEYDDYSIYEDKLVICTQLFYDMGQTENGADIKQIKQICNIAERNNIKVIIKPHPREKDLDKYLNMGVEVDSSNLVPFEVIVAGLRNKPRAIIGITTTTLVTANVLWGINTISIVDVIGKNNFHKEVKEDIENFSKLFSKYVKVPQNMTSLFDYILS